jgi:hypothetical protein
MVAPGRRGAATGEATMVDIYALTLLAISFTIFIKRFLKEEPPVAPYLVIALTCAAATIIGQNGAELGAMVLLIAASFLFLGCLMQSRGKKREAAADND